MAKQYETVIGLEVHVELATKTKIFCGCSTAFGAEPNTHTCPVCTGMPGSLPVLNRQVVEYAMGVGLATDCEITRLCKFDRKNYFYPDNPQNYQISQLYLPICRNGRVEIETAAGKKYVGNPRDPHGGGRGKADPRRMGGHFPGGLQPLRRPADRDRVGAGHAERGRGDRLPGKAAPADPVSGRFRL